jgi:hypothetical protein
MMHIELRDCTLDNDCYIEMNRRMMRRMQAYFGIWRQCTPDMTCRRSSSGRHPTTGNFGHIWLAASRRNRRTACIRPTIRSTRQPLDTICRRVPGLQRNVHRSCSSCTCLASPGNRTLFGIGCRNSTWSNCRNLCANRSGDTCSSRDRIRRKVQFHCNDTRCHQSHKSFHMSGAGSSTRSARCTHCKDSRRLDNLCPNGSQRHTSTNTFHAGKTCTDL